MKSLTCGVFITDGNQVIVCHPTGSSWKNGWSLPKGLKDNDENEIDAAIREVKEETGLEVYDIHLLGITESIYSKSFQNQKHFIFVDFSCRSDSDEVILNEEAESYQWIELNEIEDYELEEFTANLLKELRKGNESKYKQEIIYGL